MNKKTVVYLLLIVVAVYIIYAFYKKQRTAELATALSEGIPAPPPGTSLAVWSGD